MSWTPRTHRPLSMFAAARSPHADRAQRLALVARRVGIVSAACGTSVSSVGSSADGSSPDAYRHATTYGCATINTCSIRASVMNANAANANAANAGAPTAIGEGIT
jgi:hypothetical protein